MTIEKLMVKDNMTARKLYNGDEHCVYACDTVLGRALFCVPWYEAIAGVEEVAVIEILNYLI